jgi:hypothetical protein
MLVGHQDHASRLIRTGQNPMSKQCGSVRWVTGTYGGQRRGQTGFKPGKTLSRSLRNLRPVLDDQGTGIADKVIGSRQAPRFIQSAKAFRIGDCTQGYLIERTGTVHRHTQVRGHIAVPAVMATVTACARPPRPPQCRQRTVDEVGVARCPEMGRSPGRGAQPGLIQVVDDDREAVVRWRRTRCGRSHPLAPIWPTSNPSLTTTLQRATALAQNLTCAVRLSRFGRPQRIELQGQQRSGSARRRPP